MSEKIESPVDMDSIAEKNGSDHSEDPTRENKVNFSFVMTMTGLSMAFVVAEVTPLFFVTSFSLISNSLGALDKTIWVLVAPYIATGAIAPFVGSLSDLIGRKGIILFSLVLGIISFILQGAAPNFGCYLTGATIAGAAIGIQILTVIAAASELVPVSKRGSTIGLIVLGFLPFAPASLYATCKQLTAQSRQLLIQKSWRYIYVLLGGWSVLSFVVLAIFYRPPPRPAMIAASKRDIISKIDFVGCALSILGIVVFLIGINWGGADYAWNSPQVICTLVFGIVTLVVFGLYEKFVAKHPMFPARIMKNRLHFASITALCLLSGINYVPLTVFWTIQTYTVYGASFTQAGIWLLPLGFCIAGGAIIAAIAISIWKKHIQWILLFFCILQTVGVACMGLFDKANINSVWGPMIIALIGIGAVLLPSQIVYSIICDDDLIGTSVALSVTVRMLGQVVGKSMFYNIFRNKVQTVARGDVTLIGLPAVQAGFGIENNFERITRLVTTMTAGPLSHYLDLFPEIDSQAELDKIIAGGQEVYARAFPLIYYVSIPFGVLSVISCFGLIGIKKYINNNVSVHL